MPASAAATLETTSLCQSVPQALHLQTFVMLYNFKTVHTGKVEGRVREETGWFQIPRDQEAFETGLQGSCQGAKQTTGPQECSSNPGYAHCSISL